MSKRENEERKDLNPSSNKKVAMQRQQSVLYSKGDPDDMTNARPIDAFSNSLLTDMYQITMCYAYWVNGKQDQHAIFDLYFRKNPFQGEYTVFGGLEEAVKYINDFKFIDSQIDYLKEVLPDAHPDFFIWLSNIKTDQVCVYALKEGTICFPNVPLLRVEGPIAVCQLLETPLLTLINYPSLVATNAARMRKAAGNDKTLLEFGLRRAQGPNGGVSASRYSYMGGFDGTSNMLAGYLFGIPTKGTHAHAFVSSFTNEDEPHLLKTLKIDGKLFLPVVYESQKQLGYTNTNKSELLAFASYAAAFPKNLLALVDTYDTIKSGVLNFLSVALALHKFGYKATGIRLDSGDLSYLSKEARSIFKSVSTNLNNPELEYFGKFNIVASNDLNESTLLSLNQQGHEIDTFGIGTHLVTCQAQPALGCVFKLVEIDQKPRIKVSQEYSKVTIPGRKEAYRIFSKTGEPLVDLMVLVDEKQKPVVNEPILCQHPLYEIKRATVRPGRVEPLQHLVYENGKIVMKFPNLNEIRSYVQEQLKSFRPDHLRASNPTPYKVSISESLSKFMKEIWAKEMPIAILE